MAKYQQTKTFN